MANEVNLGAYTPSCLPGPFPPGEPFPRIPGKPWVPDPTTPRIPVGQSGASGIIEGIISIAFAIFGSTQPQAQATRETGFALEGPKVTKACGLSPMPYHVPMEFHVVHPDVNTNNSGREYGFPSAPPSSKGKCNIL